ncbi:MAG: DUF4838 domain-containing protein [Kiritimatiellaeota bacterium]|nr:DUF4838 domain-containing protein [Kiritimatiellota bacterium]
MRSACCLLWPGLTAFGLAAGGVPIARHGAPAAVIRVRNTELDQRMSAARELRDCLREATGALLPIQPFSESARGPCVVLGTASDFPKRAGAFQMRELGTEGIVVRSQGGRVWILGNSERALGHAVFGFLEAVGFRWFFPDPVWTVVPRVPNLDVRVDLRQAPAFAHRRIWYGWGPRTPKLRTDYDAWFRHNRQSGAFGVHCSHSYAWHIPRREFKEHPDWFALVKGKRQPSQLCVSNPEVQARIVRHALEVFRREPQRNMVSVEPNDGSGYCQCPKCRALGSESDQAFSLANIVARGVRREFPEKWVGMYAYAGHAEPPRFPIAPGVYVQITTGFRYTKLSFDAQVKAFRDLGARVGVYDYFSVYPWDWDLPGAAKAGRPVQLAVALRHYSELGLSTYSAESSCNWGPNGPGYWMAAHLMWDPAQDPRALLQDFYSRAFGQAAKPMQRLYERWGRGERFSLRTLKLALLDLKEAYAAEASPAVRARLDRVAMYLHWLRLWGDYDRSARWNQWGKLVVSPPEEITRRARECIVFARRIMDTGMIHAWPALHSSWFARRFAALKRIDGFEFKKTTAAWKKERTDIPGPTEVAADFTSDLQRFRDLPAVEITGRVFSGRLAPLRDRLPGAVAAWGEPPRSPLFVESGTHWFAGKAGEVLDLEYRPFDGGHTIDCRWTLRDADGKTMANGHAKAAKGKSVAVRVPLSKSGLYAFDPGTGYWHAAQIGGIDGRPLVVWAGRADRPGKPRRTPLRLWLPRRGAPLYFFVPKGTRHFVIGIVSGGDPFTSIRLRTADGKTVLDEKVLAGSEVSIIVERDRREYGAESAIANHTVVPGHEASVTVPTGADGAIWSIELSSLRCIVELYDVPPWLARQPAELMAPEDALASRGGD